MGVRVLRIIEYVYADEERAADDMLRWTHSHRDKSMTMKTAVLPMEAVEWTEPETEK